MSLRHKPTKPYSGLTIVMSQPSRFDISGPVQRHKLISGNAEYFFTNECLSVSRESCDIRTAESLEQGLLPETKAVLLLGEKSMHTWADPMYKEYSVNEQRGNPLRNKWNLPCIVSYLPQDAMDMQDWESKYNPELNKEHGNEEEYQGEDDDEEDIFATKRKGKTRRGNYRFWLKADTRKIVGKQHTGLPGCSNKNKYILAPSSELIIEFLSSITESDNLYIDIETSVDGCYNLFCIGVATDTSPIYVIPIFRYNGSFFYSSIWRIMALLAKAIETATVVSHNGFGFDIPILAWRYHLPVPRRNYDTIIGLHRSFPKVEKSLGHGISLFLWRYYHKDKGNFHPKNIQDEQELWSYNAEDVEGTRELKWAIDDYAKTVPGLQESIIQGNRCIYPYTLMSLNGMAFSDAKRQEIMLENDKLMLQYLRMIQIFLDELQYKGRLLPSSPKSCVAFFHEFMNYAVVGRSQTISKKTGRPLNTPSLNEKNFWKLKLKYPDNFLIDLCVKYRQVKKDTGMLKFVPWDFNKPLREMLLA